jgi:hypothetical protein
MALINHSLEPLAIHGGAPTIEEAEFGTFFFSATGIWNYLDRSMRPSFWDLARNAFCALSGPIS